MTTWLDSYLVVLRWQALRIKYQLPLIVVVQAVLAVGVVIGFAFLLPAIDTPTALYLTTGAPTLILIVTGLVVVPQYVAQAKVEGSFEYMRSWPVGRMVYLAADTTVWLLATLPGIALALVVAALRFQLQLQISPLVVPAFLLVALTATGVGYGLASLLPPPLTRLLTQVLVFGALLFSPIDFPVTRLPDWLMAVHGVLPIQSMADVIRGTLAGGTFQVPGSDFAVLGTWCLGGIVATYVVMRRRR